MIVVGLTGGIASGKSTVARMFAQEGIHIIDIDELSRSVVEPHKPAWHEIVRAFGETILRGDGILDRGRLGAIVFANPEERKKLEHIVHPRIFEAYKNQLKQILGNDRQPTVIVDVPLLMEPGSAHDFEFDKVIVVYTPPDDQIRRLVERDGLSQEAASDRLQCQIPIKEKTKAADFVIDNSRSLEKTRQQVKEVYKALKMLEKKKGQAKKERRKRGKGSASRG